MSKFFGRKEHPNQGLSDRRLQVGALRILGALPEPELLARERLMKKGDVPKAFGELSVPELMGFVAYREMGGATDFVAITA